MSTNPSDPRASVNPSLSSGTGGGPPAAGASGQPASGFWRPELGPPGQAGLVGAVGEQTGLGEDRAEEWAEGPGRVRASLSKANLLVFGLFLGGVGVVAFMSLRGGPQATSAAQQQSEQKAKSAIERFLAANPASGAAPDASSRAAKSQPSALLRDTRALVQVFLTFSSKTQVPVEDLRVNPFRFPVAQTSAQAAPTPEQQKQLDAARQAEEATRKKRLEKMRADAGKLKLQTVVNGPAGRKAMINATVVQVGDVVDGFTVQEIQARRVLLTCEGETFTLEISF